MAPSSKKGLAKTHQEMRSQTGMVSFDDYLQPPPDPKKASKSAVKVGVKVLGGGKTKQTSVGGLPVSYGGFGSSSASSSSTSLASSSKSKSSASSLASSKSKGSTTSLASSKSKGSTTSLASSSKGKPGDVAALKDRAAMTGQVNGQKTMAQKAMKAALAAANGLDILSVDAKINPDGTKFQVNFTQNNKFSLFPSIPGLGN